MACTPLHRVELVPPASGHGAALEARVVSASTGATDTWYVAYEVELRNPSAAPIDVDLAAARLAIVSLLDASQVTAAPIAGGDGAAPGHRPADDAPPGHVTVGAGETRAVWLAFGGALEPRARLARRETLSLPGGVELVIDERTAAQPGGIRGSRGRRRALAAIVRSGLELGHAHVGVAVPYDLGAAVLYGDLRLEVHFGHRIFDEAIPGGYTRTGAFASGPEVSWQLPYGLGVYGDVDYTRLAPDGLPRANGVVVGGGVTYAPLHQTFGSAYDHWQVPLATLRVGWAETYATGSSSGTFRIGLEIAPAWLW